MYRPSPPSSQDAFGEARKTQCLRHAFSRSSVTQLKKLAGCLDRIVSSAERLLTLKWQLILVEICRSLGEKGLTKREAYPLWIS